MKMQIRTVAMIGAGNLGAYVVRGLTCTLGDDLWVIAEGARKERLEKDGLIINDKPYTLHVRTPEEASGADLIIICVKYQALREILPAVKTIAGPHTLVMSLMNGVDSEEILAEAIPKEADRARHDPRGGRPGRQPDQYSADRQGHGHPLRAGARHSR
jgi:2-dehydropantoate 2-reductase